MAKSQTAKPASKPVQPPAPSKRPAASEIDDIFSKKQKLDPAPPPPAADASGKKKKKAKAKAPVVETSAAPGPVTIVDTSASIERYKNAPAPLARKRKADAGDEEEKKGDEAEENFMASRGTNRRRTDDGLAIYDISELRIGLGGDTELCPFDCQCCF